MKNYLLSLLTFLYFYCFSAYSQLLIVSPLELNFPILNEKQIDSLSFTITNTDNEEVIIQILQPFRVFKSNPYWVKDTLLTLPANGTKSVIVYCNIAHNTANPSNLIIRSTNNYRLSDAFIKLSCQGKYRKAYYNSTQNLSEETLKQALKVKLVQNVASISYDVARDKMYASIDNKNDSVTCVYTNRKARFNSRAGANSNNFNCEHTFPQGFFGQGLPMRSDIHHLFSTDEDANNSRGNLPFGIAKAPIDAIAINAPSKRGGGVYEPQDSHKGNCARSMMYFVLRYQDYQNFYASKKQDSVFRAWNVTFLPKPKDTLRNAMIFAEQNNRNPFIDYPQFANRIKNLIGVSISDSVQKIGISSQSFVHDGAPGLTRNLVVWNEGNKKIKISNVRFTLNSPIFLNNSNQNFTLGYNEAKTIGFTLQPLVAGLDTLVFDTDAPGFASVKVLINAIIISNKNQLSFKTPQIFPNPGLEITYIDNLEAGNQAVKIQISNVQGKLVKENLFFPTSGKAQLNVADLAPGIYQVKIEQRNRVDQLRFVKP